MKKLAIAIGILAAIIAFVSYNVWRANEEPVTTPPTAVQVGRQQLHDQLEKAKAREAEIEKQDWDSVLLLRQLIDSHQRRIDQLAGNSQADEIVAHDKQAIARLQQRIADLNAAAAAQPPSSSQSGPESTPPTSEPPHNPATR